MEKQNTDGSAKSLGGIIKDIRQKAKNNPLLISALKKLVNMTPDALEKFLGKTQTWFGRLKKVVPDISLSYTPGIFVVSDFFKAKDNGGIFSFVDSDIFDWFDSEEVCSSAEFLAGYELTELITEENIIRDARTGKIYKELDFAIIKQICERHILKGEKLLLEDGKANLFWVRNKKAELCRVYVYLEYDGWIVFVHKFDATDEWNTGDRFFFRN